MRSIIWTSIGLSNLALIGWAAYLTECFPKHTGFVILALIVGLFFSWVAGIHASREAAERERKRSTNREIIQYIEHSKLNSHV